MFGIFKAKNKKNAKKTASGRSPESEELRRRVQQQIADKRAEMGPEALEKLQQAMRIKQAKKEVQSAVQDDRRQEVVNRIRDMRESDD